MTKPSRPGAATADSHDADDPGRDMGHDTGHADALEAALLSDFVAIVALRFSFDHGVLDRLAANPAASPRASSEADLARVTSVRAEDLGLPVAAAENLLAMLHSAGVVARSTAAPGDDRWRMTGPMAALWRIRRDELEARVRFVAMAAADVLADTDALLLDLPRFIAQSRTFGFFRYGRAQGTKAAELEDTAPWVRYVTALTRAEAAPLAPLIPLDGCGHLIEVGGNTGAFALALLRRHPALTATVLDLPAVCRLGQDHIAGRDGAARLTFHPGDAHRGDWPARSAQAVLFKSVLHDWEHDAARAMLRRAWDHLDPGGRLIVCERGAFADERRLHGIGTAANLVFAPFYRPPDFYAEAMRDMGMQLAPVRSARLDMTFHIVVGTKAR
ncbi:methyltransferase [Brevirhabdus sp.]|uniref:methyltransferase n=1 Tax=Brevirhabdus sp. TaxID=2004514 RepID=UPI0040590C24